MALPLARHTEVGARARFASHLDSLHSGTPLGTDGGTWRRRWLPHPQRPHHRRGCCSGYACITTLTHPLQNQRLSYTIVQALGSSQRPYRLTVLTNPSQKPYLPPRSDLAKITHKTSDFSPASLESAFAGHDLVISTTAGGDYEFQVRVIDAALAAGVRRFIPNEFGQDSLNEAVQARLPPSRERARVIQYLKDAQGQSDRGVGAINGGERDAATNGEGRATDGTGAKLEWVAAAVGCILDQKLISGDLGFDLKWQSATVHGTGSEQFAVTSLARIGVVVDSIIQRWEAVKNRYLYACGCIATANQIVEFLQKSTKKAWEVGKVDTADCVREGQRRIERGWPDAGMFLMERSVLYDGGVNGVAAFLESDARRLLGLDEESTEAIVEHAVHEFTHHGKGDCGCG